MDLYCTIEREGGREKGEGGREEGREDGREEGREEGREGGEGEREKEERELSRQMQYITYMYMYTLYIGRSSSCLVHVFTGVHVYTALVWFIGSVLSFFLYN